jgi:hypothetical protein
MIRREFYRDGRLVREIDQVDVTSSRTMAHEYVDGRHRWLLDGEEITEAEAQAELGNEHPG